VADPDRRRILHEDGNAAHRARDEHNRTRDQLRLAIIIWIEKTYHRRRRRDRLARLTPIEFEILLQTAHAA
jgi:transposase InsO family protein